MNKNKKLVIIDYSSLLYSACYNNQVVDEKTDNFKDYKDSIDFYTESIFNDLDADFYIAVGDGYTSFRKKKYPHTKDDRKGKPSMKFLKDLKEYAYTKYNVITDNSLEADDICLILANYYKDKYEVIIASKDSDLRQAPATFYNYGWRRALYGKGKSEPSEKALNEAFNNAIEIIDTKKADFNLWKSVLIKGHNNKQNYLNGCGEKTAESYLNYNIDTYPIDYLVLNAFINGISKTNYIKRGIKGFGLNKGIDEYSKSFEQTYLLRTFDEVSEKFGEVCELEHSVNEIIKLDKNEEAIEEKLFSENGSDFDIDVIDDSDL